jgi:hypothetical protein
MGRTAVAEHNVGGGRGQDPGSSGDRGPYEWRLTIWRVPVLATQALVLRVIRHNKRGDPQDDHQADVGRSLLIVREQCGVAMIG